MIYANDNYGEWRQDFDKQVKLIERKSEKGRRIVELLRPDADDYYVLKPQRSAFFETPLGFFALVEKKFPLVITGVTTDICVLFTAHDAYMRGFSVAVPNDCCAAALKSHHEAALQMLRRVTNAQTDDSSLFKFK